MGLTQCICYSNKNTKFKIIFKNFDVGNTKENSEDRRQFTDLAMQILKRLDAMNLGIENGKSQPKDQKKMCTTERGLNIHGTRGAHLTKDKDIDRII